MELIQNLAGEFRTSTRVSKLQLQVQGRTANTYHIELDGSVLVRLYLDLNIKFDARWAAAFQRDAGM